MKIKKVSDSIRNKQDKLIDAIIYFDNQCDQYHFDNMYDFFHLIRVNIGDEYFEGDLTKDNVKIALDNISRNYTEGDPVNKRFIEESMKIIDIVNRVKIAGDIEMIEDHFLDIGKTLEVKKIIQDDFIIFQVLIDGIPISKLEDFVQRFWISTTKRLPAKTEVKDFRVYKNEHKYGAKSTNVLYNSVILIRYTGL